jgi:hypothetical protein
VLASPFALRLLPAKTADWTQLSLMGQTYGAASALLAALALIGVAFALFMQAREAKTNREQALRALHAELMKMAMDDSLYRRAWGPFFESADPDSQREHMYVNLIVSQWEMEYELKAIGEDHLRSIARVVFSGLAGQRFWRNVRDLRMASSSNRRERRFHEILDEEYQLATRSSAIAPQARTADRSLDSRRERRGRIRRLLPFLVLGAGIAAMLRAVRRARRQPSPLAKEGPPR